jgi:hypothetical protein
MIEYYYLFARYYPPHIINCYAKYCIFDMITALIGW